MYVKVANNAVDTFPYSVRKLRSDNPQTSFPAVMTDDMLSSWDVYPVTISDKPSTAHNEVAEKNNTPTLSNNVWTLGWTTRSLTTDEVNEEKKIQRETRDTLLAECDWTQMPDSPLSDSKKTEWATYRTNLRNVPTQSGFPTNITWPTKPS